MDQHIEDVEPMAAAVDDHAAEAAPWHLWAVGVVSLLWNAFGAMNYTMSQLRNPSWLEGMTRDMGVSVEEMIAYIDSFPAWSHACWALGVWGALIGSLLLLLRKRHAVWAFGVSLLGLAGTSYYQATAPRPEWAEQAVGMTLVIWSIATFLLIYAVSMKNKGVLR